LTAAVIKLGTGLAAVESQHTYSQLTKHATRRNYKKKYTWFYGKRTLSPASFGLEDTSHKTSLDQK